MSSSIDQLFEHSLVLTSKEPNFFEQTQHLGDERYRIMTLEEACLTGNFADFVHCPHTKELLQKCNFISILKVGWNKVYDQDPEFTTVFDPKDGISDLEEQILAGKWSQTAHGRTKKLAQHKAAANVILDIIKSGRHKEFLIPGRDADEAHKLITKAMNSLLDIQSIEAMEVDGNGDNPIKGNIVQQGGITIMQHQQITNWVGRVQELIMKKRIVCKWNDAYTCQNEKTNNIMHNCKLQFDILDSTANNLLKRLEADSQARNKKMAKQLAFCKIHELLIAEYGHFNQLNEREIKSKDNLIVIDEQISKEVLVVDDKEKKEISNNDTTTNTITTQISSLSTNKFSLTLSPNDLQELEHIERSQDWDETIDIRLLLSDLLNDRAVNTPRSERLLRCILKGKNPQVERVFYKPELNFIESFKSEDNDNFQIYLEIFVIHNNKKILLCTFGGEGKDKQGARDDASWQAMEYLYIYGGFAPRGKKEY